MKQKLYSNFEETDFERCAGNACLKVSQRHRGSAANYSELISILKENSPSVPFTIDFSIIFCNIKYL